MFNNLINQALDIAVLKGHVVHARFLREFHSKMDRPKQKEIWGNVGMSMDVNVIKAEFNQPLETHKSHMGTGEGKRHHLEDFMDKNGFLWMAMNEEALEYKEGDS